MNRFNKVLTLNPGRSVFNLSYSKKMSGDMGILYPMMCDEVIPGDVFDIGCEAVIRFAPLIAPVLHEIVLKADWFFVPYRICHPTDENAGNTYWERFITGGRLGNDALTRQDLGVLDMRNGVAEGSLWDHLGIPPGVSLTVERGSDSPLKYPGYAYFKIWNEYYRDPNLEDVFDISSVTYNTAMKYANWDADYFTAALPTQQRGTAPALPISGITHALFAGPYDSDLTDAPLNVSTNVSHLGDFSTATKGILDNNEVDLSAATTFSISDLRLAVQLQRWMERNMRVGYRYTDFLQGNFGVSPRDERLDRPEYIGGITQNIIVSEVLQTSKTETGAPQGNLAGHGIMAGSHYIGKYRVLEYGLIMCIASVVPRPAYMQGINRQWLRQTRYDFPNPAFVNLSEQAVLNEEIFLGTEEASNTGIFGYQGMYDELRSKQDLVAGAFRSSLDFWHLAREFASLPSLDSTFGHTDPTTLKRIFAVPDEDTLYIHWGNKIKAVRPIPSYSNPGRMDHEYGGL